MSHSRPACLDLTLGAQRDLLRGGGISATELTSGYLAEAARQQHLNIFITQDRDAALAQARESDERLARGAPLPLDGIPVAVKDNYCTRGIRTTAGSKILANFVPDYESAVTQKLRDAGAVLIGKANMDEFAMGSSTEHSFIGPAINPAGIPLGFDNLVPGGSSGGSAAAVAAGLASAALGSDTGGSIRQPASFCGVTGFKPSYGVCSRWGIVAYGSSLDQAGVLARNVGDAALVMDVIAGGDARDSTSCPRDDYAFAAALKREPRRLKVGFTREIVAAGATADTERVWDAGRRIAAALEAETVELSVPSFKYALPAYYIIALCEASSNLARYDGVRYGYRASGTGDIIDMYEKTRAQGFGAEVRRRIMLGTFALSAGYYDAYYLTAQKVRKKIANELAAAFTRVDFLFLPTAPTAAFAIGAHSGDPLEMYLEDVYTVFANLAGLPAISLPVCASARGLPLGLQIAGKPFSDEDLLHAAAQVETARDRLGLLAG